MAVEDPFYLVKDEIQESADETQARFKRWQRGAEGRGDPGRLAEELKRECDSILWQLDELSRAVDAADRDKERFQVDQSEVERRRSWVEEERRLVQGMKSQVESQLEQERRTKNQEGQGKERRDLMGQGLLAPGGEEEREGGNEENEQFLRGAEHEQKRLIERQDEDLEELSKGVVRLGEVGKTIGEELSQQNKMLTEVEGQADTVSSRLRAAERKMQQVLKKAGVCGQLAIIAALIVILIILIAIAFS